MIDENSNEYKIWKSYYGISYFEEQSETKFLFYNDSKNYKWQVDNISLNDFNEIHYLSWTEENCGLTKLFIFELEPQRNRILEWTISPSKGECLFWINKWKKECLFIIYNDSITNYALKIECSKKPKGISLQVKELGEMICVKKDWTVGFKFYTENIISIFDLKNFVYLNQLSREQAILQNYITAEGGERIEELE